MSEWEAIVLDIDGGERLQRCLRSIEGQSVPPARIIIIDNGSTLPVRERISERNVVRKVIRSARNLGFTGGVNLGWRESEAAFVALINNDVELDRGWAEAMMAACDDPGLGGVQSIVMSPDGTVDGAGVGIEAGRFLQLGHGQLPGQFSEAPWGVSATAALYRRTALKEVSIEGCLLHPAFFAYYEDVELSARLLGAGWRLTVVPRPLVVHEGSQSASRLGLRADYLRTRNRYFVRRLHPEVGRYGALLAEDARKIARAFVGIELRRAGAILLGVLAGCFGRINETDSRVAGT